MFGPDIPMLFPPGEGGCIGAGGTHRGRRWLTAATGTSKGAESPKLRSSPDKPARNMAASSALRRTTACKAPRPRLFPLGCWSCMASGRGRPCSDRAFPCCSPLASAEEAGPFAGTSGEHPAAGGRALLGSAVRPYPSPISGHGPSCNGPSCHASRGGRARDGASGASPTLYRRPKMVARA
jgi:hypothetical protein